MNPTDLRWDLPLAALRGLSTGLLGWALEMEPVDAGVPFEMQVLLTQTLCAHWKLTFPDENGVTHANGLRVTSTTDPREALRLFDQVEFPWSQRGQLALLSATNQVSPDLSSRKARELLDGKRTLLGDFPGACGVLLPAVDGDFAAVSLSDNVWSQFVNAFAVECSRNCVQWDMITETQFLETAWYAGGDVNHMDRLR